jgi:hypothetical protein
VIADQPVTSSCAQRVASIVLIFALVGPPVGGLVFFVGLWISFLVERLIAETPVASLATALFRVLMSAIVALVAVPYSYLYGIVPAAIAGLVIGILRARYGNLNPSIVLVAGGLIGVVYTVAMSRLIPVTASPINPRLAPEYFLLASDFRKAKYFLYILSCMLATLACWRFSRSFPE